MCRILFFVLWDFIGGRVPAVKRTDIRAVK